MARQDDTVGLPGVMTAIGWALAIASIMCFGLAKPEEASMFDRMIDTGRDLGSRYDPGLLRAALGLDGLAILVGLVAVALGAGRPDASKTVVLPGILIALCVVGLFVLVPKLSG